MYNLIDESWIDVKYLDGHKEEVGLKKLFCDSHLIEKIMPVSFRRQTNNKYVFCLLRFLSVIVMDAYTLNKEYYGNVKEKVYYLNNFDDNVIDNYLEKFRYCFELFDKRKPFMQGSSEQCSKKVIFGKGNLNLNSMAVADTGRIYGKEKDAMLDIVKYYNMTPKEFIYVLLYNNMCRVVGGAAGNSAILGYQDVIHVVIQGNNLKDTIVLNTVPTSREDINNIPVWRWTSIEEEEFNNKKSNTICHLSGAFFPPMLVYSRYDSETGMVETGYDNFSKDYKEYKNSIKNQWIENCEWNTFIKKNKKSSNGQFPYSTVKIDCFTPLWFFLVEYANEDMTVTRYIPRVFDSLPIDIENIKLDFFLSKTDSNCNLEYIKHINQVDIPIDIFTDKEYQDNLRCFMRDYLECVDSVKLAMKKYAEMVNAGSKSAKLKEEILIGLEARYSNILKLDIKEGYKIDLFNNVINLYDRVTISHKNIVAFYETRRILIRTMRKKIWR